MATAPTTITERPARKFEPRSVNFPASIQEEIGNWLDKNIESLKSRLRNLHENKIPELRRIIDGEPKDENKSWPFPNCSNLVHQLAGEACDDLAARVLQLIWLTSPLFYFQYLLTAKNDDEAAHFTKKGKALERFFDYAAYEPRELDLYTRENEWFIDSAGLGKSWMIVAPEQRIEAVYVGYETVETKTRVHFDNKTLYEGPKLIKARYEDILIDPDVSVFEDNDPIVRVCTLKKRKLQERSFKGHFLADRVKQVLEQPDRYGPSDIRKRENSKKGISDAQDNTMAEWDIYECYFSWYHNKKKHRLICWRHLKTHITLNCVYNFVPDNQVPIVETRLSVDGKGMAQMLKHNQEEVSTAKNQRNDAQTWSLLGINTLSPQNKNIDRNFKIWPGIMLPVNKDDFMHHEVANAAMFTTSLQNEQAMIQQARERVGIAPAVAGQGAGTVGKKGSYSSMGTIATLQDSNTRSSHRQSDFRHSHVKLGSLCTDFYGFLGLGRKGTVFGVDDKLLTEALEDFVERRARIPMRAATASMNKEVTKQNEILLNQAVSAYIKETSSQFQAYMNANIPPEYKKWIKDVIKAKTRLMQQIIRDFQISDQPEEFIPNIELPEVQPNAQAPTQGAPAGNPADKLLQMVQSIRARGGGGSAAPQPGLPAAAGGPEGQGGAA